MAVSAGVIVEIVLMIVLGRIKIFERLHLHYNRTVVKLRLGFDFRHYSVALSGVGVINAGPVLRTSVVALSVERCRVDGHKIKLNQKRQVNAVFVVNHPHGLGSPGFAGAYLLISRVCNPAVGVADFGAQHSVNLFEKVFCAPEASACEAHGIGSHISSVFIAAVAGA